MIVTHFLEFVQVHWVWMLLGSISTLVLSGLSFGAACLILVRLPPTYFSDPESTVYRIRTQTPLNGLVMVLKNICGSLIVAVGAVLALPGIPGPGILIALLGLMLMDFPAKRHFEWLLVRNPAVFSVINHFRQRCGRAPFAPRNTSEPCLHC